MTSQPLYVARDQTPVEFSRKLAVRAVGENRTETVESYIRSQVDNEHFVDERFANVLKQFTVINSAVDLNRRGSRRVAALVSSRSILLTCRASRQGALCHPRLSSWAERTADLRRSACQPVENGGLAFGRREA